MEVTVHSDRAAVAAAAAAEIAVRAAEGPMTLGLSGGSTPADTYDALGRSDLRWEHISMWLSDERWVPHDDPESNGRMALEHLPPHAGGRLRRPRFSPYMEPEDSAAHYEADLRSMHPDGRPDFVLLGMGDDGHTASLFPGTDALDRDDTRWFVANHVPRADSWRLTATPLLLRAAHRVLVLVTGESKASMLADVLEGPPGRFPIQLLVAAAGSVTVLCDRPAASRLTA